MYWTTEKVETLKKYQQTKTSEELAAMLGTTKNGVRFKAKRLGLANVAHRKIAKQIQFYGPGPQTIKENKGRSQTNKIQNIKNNMSLNKKIKLQQYMSKKVGYKPKRGRIVGITDHFIILQTKNYRECFKFSDFLSKTAILEAWYGIQD